MNSNMRSNTSSTAKCWRKEYRRRRNADEGDNGWECRDSCIGEGLDEFWRLLVGDEGESILLLVALVDAKLLAEVESLVECPAM